MNLLTYQNDLIQISPEARMLLPFKNIYDKNKVKATATKEIAYIYFMEDKSNEIGFWKISDEKERSKEVIKHVFGEKSKWKPSAYVLEAQNFYRESLTPFASKMLNTSVQAIEKILEFLDGVDWDLKKDKGDFVYDINKVRDAINKLPELEETVQKLRIRIKQEEQAESDDKRGSHKIGMYE
jgi:hypothetical protein